jgi:hypothetical protein
MQCSAEYFRSKLKDITEIEEGSRQEDGDSDRSGSPIASSSARYWVPPKSCKNSFSKFVSQHSGSARSKSSDQKGAQFLGDDSDEEGTEREPRAHDDDSCHGRGADSETRRYEEQIQALVELIQARGLGESEALDRMREERRQEREESEKELLRMQEMMQQMREERAQERQEMAKERELLGLMLAKRVNDTMIGGQESSAERLIRMGAQRLSDRRELEMMREEKNRDREERLQEREASEREMRRLNRIVEQMHGRNPPKLEHRSDVTELN